MSAPDQASAAAGDERRKRKKTIAKDDDRPGESTRAADQTEDGVDDIFAELKAAKRNKRVKTDVSAATKRSHGSSRSRKRPQRTVRDDDEDDDLAWRAGTSHESNGEPSVHRYTEEGLPVYKFYHLGMRQEDGGTPLCPFDCDCCY